VGLGGGCAGGGWGKGGVISDRGNAMEGNEGSTICEDGIGLREIKHSNFSGAKGEGKAETGGVAPGGNTHFLSKGNEFISSESVKQLNGGDVEGAS